MTTRADRQAINQGTYATDKNYEKRFAFTNSLAGLLGLCSIDDVRCYMTRPKRYTKQSNLSTEKVEDITMNQHSICQREKGNLLLISWVFLLLFHRPFLLGVQCVWEHLAGF